MTAADLDALKTARRQVNLKKGRGKHLNPTLLDALIERLEEHLQHIQTPQGAAAHEEMRLLYERALKRPFAAKLPLPLQVILTEPNTIFFFMKQVKPLVEKLAPEEITWEWRESKVHVNFGLSLLDREAFLKVVKEEPTFKDRGQSTFFQSMEEAEDAFIDSIELPESEAA